MVIGFLLNTCEPFYRGGYERRAQAFAQELARQGHTVRIYTSCPRRENLAGVEYIPLAPARPYFNARGVRNGWADLLFLGGIAQLFWLWPRQEVEILDVNATPFLHLPLVALLCWWKQIPVVATCHEALRSSISSYTRERGWKISIGLTWLLAGIYDWGMRAITQRIAVSAATEKALAKEGYACVATITFGLEPAAFHLEPPRAFPEDRPVNFVFCGRLVPLKQVDRALAALALLYETNASPWHFHVIGEGSCRAALEAQAQFAPERFTFHGALSESEKRAVLVQSEIFLLNSQREGFSIATLEAMAQGCAIALEVAPSEKTSHGALDFVRDGQEGWIVPAHEGAHLVDCLRQILAQPEERYQRRRQAWRQAQTYRIETKAQELTDVYQRLVTEQTNS